MDNNKLKRIFAMFAFIITIIALQFGASRFLLNKNDEIDLHFYEYRIEVSEIVVSTENYTGGEVTVEIHTEKPGLSIQYQLGDTGEWIDYVGPFSVSENVNVNARLVSEADNFTGPITTKEIKNIAVAKIGDEYFKTLEAAIEACAENAGDSQTKIEMLANTTENVVIPEGKNILLDLCGATITGASTSTGDGSGDESGSGSQDGANINPTITVNGKLNIIDSAKNEDGTLQGEGKVSSTTAEAIKVSGTGIFVLGTNESANESVSLTNPVIEGNTYGVTVETTAGFEFYDGKVSGKTNAINGTVTAKPENYGVVTSQENEYEVAILYQSTTVTFNKNSENATVEYETATKTIGEKIGELPTAQREGYTFLGWYTSTENGEKITADTIVTQDATYYAIWEAYTYTITYNANGGTGTTADTNAKYDEEITVPDNTFTAPNGYTFKQWNTNADGTGTSYNPGDKVINLSNQQSATVQLYAIWEDTIAPNATAPTGTGTTNSITVNCNQTDDGSGINESSIEYSIYKDGAWSEWQSNNTFENLLSNTEYQVKTRVSDNSGNGPTESEVGKISTSSIENGTLVVHKDNAQGEIITPETSSENKENQINNNIYLDMTSSTTGTTTVIVKTPTGETNTYTDDATIVTETGMYEITVQTTDGTNTVSDSYYVFIDKTVPTINKTETSTTNSITVNANAEDADSGVAEVTYIIKKGDEIVATNKTGEFTDLEDNTEYTVEITVIDKAGNVASETVTIKTEILTAGTIKFTESTSAEEFIPSNTESEKVWVNENVNTTLTQGNAGTTTYEVTAPDGTKTEYTADTQISTVEGTYTVTVTTTDGKNTETTEYYFNVDKTLPTVTINPNEKEYTLAIGETTLNIATTVTATDNENGSSLAITKYAWATSNTEQPAESEFIDFVSGTEISKSVNGGEYYLWVIVEDNAGNRVITENTTAKVSGEFNVGYTVEYNLNGGTGDFASFRKPHGENVGLSTEKPTRERYIFKGWSELADASEINYAVGGTYIKNESKILYAVWGEIVASTTIGEEVTVYESVQEAIVAAGTNKGAVVTLLKDEIAETVTVAAGQDIILDLNGKTLTNTTTNTIKTSGTLTITGEGTIDGATDIPTILNEGTETLTILSGAINASGECAVQGTGSGKIVIGTEGNESITNPSITGAVRGVPAEINVHSGIITATTGKVISGRNNITITGGYLKSSVNDYIVIGSTSNSVITITGGVIEQTGRAEAVTTGNETEAKIIISGGKIIGNSYAAVNNKKGETIITGGEIAGQNGIRSENGITKVSGGTITGINYGIYTLTGNVEISGTAEITGQAGVYITDTGNVIVRENPVITGTSYMAIGINAGTGEITGGTITGETYGVSATGSVTIGDNSNEVSVTTLRVQGKQAGIIVNSDIKEFNFYDGILIGTDSISGIDEPTAVPDGYCVENGTEIIDGVQYETSYLATKNYEITQGATLADVVQVGDYVNYDANSNGEKTFTSSDCLAGSSISDTISTANSFYTSAPAQWRVLSVDKETGLVELMAADPTTQTVTLTGGDGFVNAETVLNNIGAIYGSGKGATGGRSIKIEDIEQYSSYDKTTYPNSSSSTGYYGGTKAYTSGNFYKEIKDEYGNITGYETITTEASASSPVTMTLTYYHNIAKNYFSNSTIYNMIFTNSTSTSSNKSTYWLASRSVYLYTEYSRFSVCRIFDGSVTNHSVYYSSGNTQSPAFSLVPVVSLQTNIQTTGKDANGVWQLKLEETAQEATTSSANYYSTLQSAIENAATGSTIKVLNGIEETTEPTVPAEKGLVLDLNGKTTTLNGVSLTNNGGLTITGEGTLTSANADTIVNSGRLKKSGNGTIENTGASNVAINNTGMVNVIEGTVTGNSKAISTTSGIVALGANDGTVSTNNPIINGADTGVSIESGKFNFYDGVVKGASSKSIVGTVADVATGCVVVKSTSDGIETAILKQQYVITYNANGGESAPASQLKIHDEDVVLSADILYRDYYVFKGWATTPDATTAEYLPGATYTQNSSATLYAVWVDAVATTTVGESVMYYETVQGAIDGAGSNSGAVVTLLKDEIAEKCNSG